MKISFDFRPLIYKARTKSELTSKIINRGTLYTISSKGNGYMDEKYFYAVNYVKLNKKTSQKKRRINGKSKTTSTIIREKHWVGYVYMVPLELLKYSGKKINQKNRNFVIS